MENRARFGFSVEQKQYAKDRAGIGLTGELKGGKCEFPGEECFNKPERFVAHLTGCLEAKLEGMTPESITDVRENGMLQCVKHNEFHDIQEKEHIEFLRQGVIYEAPFKRNKHHRTQRRRRR
jgi:hypothetical protein